MKNQSATRFRAGLMGAGDKNKLDKLATTATSDPTTADDSSRGYFVGARWINTATQGRFVCTSSSLGTAAWVNETTGGSGSGGNTTTGANVALVNGLMGGSF